MTGARGPLAGLRVVEIAGLGPVPHAALILAELGAEVVRIDRLPGTAGFGSLPAGLGRSRPSVAVDLTSPEGVEVILRLLEDADVLLEGMRPGRMERLGLGPEVVRERAPQVIYARMTGWGQDGPMAQRAGHDITYAALSGALHLTGGTGRPTPPANLLADFGGGSTYLVIGVLAALIARGRTGTGQVVDAAMVDGAALNLTIIHGLLGTGLWQEKRGINLLDGGAPFYDTYACADGLFLAVCALEPQFHAELCRVLGVDPPVRYLEPSTWPAQRAAFTAAFRSRSREEWLAVFDGVDACVAPVLTPSEAVVHPHAVARAGYAATSNGPVPRVAPRFSQTPGADPGTERLPGADTTAYLLAHGFGAEQIADLLARGVLGQSST